MAANSAALSLSPRPSPHNRPLWSHRTQQSRFCFSPEEDCAAFAVRAIDNAEREILVGAYGLTTGSGIVEALVRAKQRGVDVQLIADKTRHALQQAGSRLGRRRSANLDRRRGSDRACQDDGH